MNKDKTPEELEVNDTFYIKYGFNHIKFRVHRKLKDGVWAHHLGWLKKDSIPLSCNELRASGYMYSGKMSKLRAFFLL